ncbi:hypothetical protein D3C80_1040210 [compost metagenome]
MLVNVVQRAPEIAVRASQSICYEGFAFFEVVRELVLFSIAPPVANDPPFVVRLRLKQRWQAVGRSIGSFWRRVFFRNGVACPLVLADGAASQLMALQIALFGIAEAAYHLTRCIQDFLQLPTVGVAVADQQLVPLYSGRAFVCQKQP